MVTRKDLDSMSIEQLQGLEQAARITIRQKTVRKAREEGRTFARLKDIPAPEGHTHHFRKTENIGIRYSAGGKIQHLSNYRCKCGETAYSCMNCEYVPGNPGEEKYDNIGILSGSAGYVHSCRVCGEELGRVATTMS